MAKGNRGGKRGGSKNAAFTKNAQPQKFETYARGGSLHRRGYEATVSGDDPSVLTLGKVDYNYDYANATRTTTPVTFEVTHGFMQKATVGTTPASDIFDYGINWANVTEIKGETRPVREALKSLGFRWDSNSGSWKKPRG